MFERKARKSRWPVVAAVALTVGVVGVFGFIGYGFVTIGERTETQLAADAKAAYDAGKFGEAAETYRKVGDEYPGSANVDEYYFLAALSDARAAADSVTAREEPAPSRAKLAEFLAVYADSPYARPDVTFGTDVAALGRKVADNFADHGTDRLAKFRTDRTKPESLEAAERAAADGPPLLASLETFRGKDTPGFDDLRKKFDAVADAARKERDRLAVLAPFRTLADDPTDEAIETAEAKFRQTGLANDAEAKAIIAHAKERLRQLIGAVPDARAATRVPADLTPPVLFVAAPLGSPDPRVAPDAVPDVVFAVARGVLYALDADSGRPLWGHPRRRPDRRPARRRPAGPGDRFGRRAGVGAGRRRGERPAGGLAARVARTGEPVWYQPLDAPLAGRPAVVGRRVYVPLADPLGTVEEFQLTTGMRVGHLAIRQPVGGGLAALSGLQSGSGFLFVPADARRVFVFEVGREGDDGTREPPRCVRVIATGHPRDSLRGEPVLVSPPAGDGPRYLILPQTDGPAAMKLRCFTLPSPTEMAVEGGPEADGTGPVAPVAEVTIPGWSWFPPAADGERVVAATDAGAVAVFGVNQAGNADKGVVRAPRPRPGDRPDRRRERGEPGAGGGRGRGLGVGRRRRPTDPAADRRQPGRRPPGRAGRAERNRRRADPPGTGPGRIGAGGRGHESRLGGRAGDPRSTCTHRTNPLAAAIGGGRGRGPDSASGPAGRGSGRGRRGVRRADGRAGTRPPSRPCWRPRSVTRSRRRWSPGRRTGRRSGC